MALEFENREDLIMKTLLVLFLLVCCIFVISTTLRGLYFQGKQVKIEKDSLSSRVDRLEAAILTTAPTTATLATKSPTPEIVDSTTHVWGGAIRLLLAGSIKHLAGNQYEVPFALEFRADGKPVGLRLALASSPVIDEVGVRAGEIRTFEKLSPTEQRKWKVELLTWQITGQQPVMLVTKIYRER